jgi:hypothetical protein
LEDAVLAGGASYAGKVEHDANCELLQGTVTGEQHIGKQDHQTRGRCKGWSASLKHTLDITRHASNKVVGRHNEKLFSIFFKEDRHIRRQTKKSAAGEKIGCFCYISQICRGI